MKEIEALFKSPGRCDIPRARLTGMFRSLFKDASVKINCGDGWTALLANMLLILKQSQSPVKIFNIIEYYGLLRVNYENGDYFSRQVIELAQNSSRRICSVCGRRGRIEDVEGWFHVICKNNECYGACAPP